MNQFGRKIIVTFSGNGASLSVNNDSDTNRQIRVQFVAQKSISGSANKATLTIYNLSESSRSAIGRELTRVTVEAGYVSNDSVGIIFDGQIRDHLTSRENADIVSSISLADGDEALRTGTINESFPVGTTPQELVEALFLKYEAIGVNRGERIYPENLESVKMPYVMSGSVKSELNKLGRTHGFYWSIQNNVFEVMPSDGWLPQSTVVNSNTGMIGLPKNTDNGIKVKSLLNPQVRPKRLIQVSSDIVDVNSDGEFRVGSIDYELDNRGGENAPFYMSIHGESIQDNKVNQGEL